MYEDDDCDETWYRPGKKKRNRTNNFTSEEKSLLLRLANKRKLILENRKTDSRSNSRKNQAWIDISNEYNRCNVGPSRDAKVLRQKYECVRRTIQRALGIGVNGNGLNETKTITPPLTEEEIELKETIILSHEGLLPTEDDLDQSSSLGLPLIHTTNNFQDSEDENNDNDEDDDNKHTNAEDSILPDVETDWTNGNQNSEALTVPIRQMEHPKPSSLSHRRRLLRKKCPPASSQLEEHKIESERKINAIRERTVWLERQTAEANLETAKARLRTAQIEEEIANIKKQKLLESLVK